MDSHFQAVEQRLQAAIGYAEAAGSVTLQHFQRDDLVVDRKSDESPVTVADREAELLLRRKISADFPEDSIVGEEFGSTAGTSGYVWVLDPIDGTKSFIHGVPLYTTLIGILETANNTPEQGIPRAGVIHAPALAETAWGQTGGGAFFRRGTAVPVRCCVSQTSSLSQSLLVTSEVATFATGRPADATETFLRLQSACRLVRTWGDGYGYMLVASGRADVAIDPRMNLWDAAALMPIVVEAGGHFVDWQGHPTVHSGDALATNGQVTAELLSLLKT
jgi:histidinol phosphatase-like enzyme (inositol monophosphatase family)